MANELHEIRCENLNLIFLKFLPYFGFFISVKCVMYKKYRFNISCVKMVGFNLRFVLVFVFREMVSCSICSFSWRHVRPSVHHYYSCYLSKSGQITQERIMKLIDIRPPLQVSVHETIACKVLHQLFTLQLILCFPNLKVA